jgi:Pentapeptide repeats (8 copies)
MDSLETSVVFWAIIAALVFVAITLALPALWVHSRFATLPSDKKAELADAYRKTTAQILGAAAIAATWSWTWVKDHQTLEQTRSQAEQSRIQSANQQYSELLKLVSSKDSVEAKVAGIYPLEGLVQARRDYYTPVLNTLKSTIRKNEPKPAAEGVEKTRVGDDVMAAIYVIGQLPLQPVAVDMQHLYLVGGNFVGLPGYRGGDFQGATLFATNFSGADLTKAKFGGAQMSDWESVGSIRWRDGALAAEWAGPKAWERVQFVVKFDYADLTGASFKGMSVAGASFQHADLTGTTFEEVDLSRADFQQARNLEKAVFTKSCYGGPGEPLGLSGEILKKLISPCP